MVKTNKLRILEPSQYHDWDLFVDKAPQGSFFHYSDWLTTCEKHLNSHLKLFGFFIDNELVGGCPLFTSNSYGFISTITTRCPTGPYGGLIFNLPPELQDTRYSIINLLCQKFEKEFKNGIFDSITIVNSPAMNDIRYFLWNGWGNQIRYTYYIDLQRYENPAFIRNIEKKFKKTGITIEVSSDIDAFNPLLEATWLRRGYKERISESFIKEVFRIFEPKNKIKMIAAKNDVGEVVAANLILLKSDCIYAWLAATGNESWKTGVHYALYSYIIQEYQELGYSFFDIMMANTKNLLPFAHCFNPIVMPYFIITKKGLFNRIYNRLLSKQKGFYEF